MNIVVINSKGGASKSTVALQVASTYFLNEKEKFKKNENKRLEKNEITKENNLENKNFNQNQWCKLD